jgi:Flp pilus assembly protein TadD
MTTSRRPHLPTPWKPLVLAWGKACVLAGLLTLAHGAAQAQAETWTPGNSLKPQIQSTPHEDVKTLLRQEKYAQALPLVDKYLVNNPLDPEMRFWKGFLLERLGQEEAARAIYLALTQEHPELAEPFNNLAVMAARHSDYAQAKEFLEQSLRANPGDPTAHENMGDILLQLARQSYAQALREAPNQRSAAQKLELLKPALALTEKQP